MWGCPDHEAYSTPSRPVRERRPLGRPLNVGCRPAARCVAGPCQGLGCGPPKTVVQIGRQVEPLSGQGRAHARLAGIEVGSPLRQLGSFIQRGTRRLHQRRGFLQKMPQGGLGGAPL